MLGVFAIFDPGPKMTEFLECGPFSARTGERGVLFDAVSVSLPERRFVCLDGPSGSGKTTLLRFMTGLAWAPDAQRRLEGESYGPSELPAWRAKVCLIAQDAPMVSGTVHENLSFPFSQLAARGRELGEHDARGLLGRVGLGELPFDRNVSLLSGGERHRLALVRGLLWDPPVLVTDEVLSGLDPKSVEACLELLLAFARKPGHLLICVLHDPALCKAADRRLHLRGGRLEED